MFEDERTREDLTFEDVKAIEAGAPLGESGGHQHLRQRFRRKTEVKYQEVPSDTAMVIGMNESWPTVMSLPATGPVHHRIGSDRSARVCVLGSELADTLFPSHEPPWQGDPCRPRGFHGHQRPGQARPDVRPEPEAVGLPITALMKYFPYEKDGLELQDALGDDRRSGTYPPDAGPASPMISKPGLISATSQPPLTSPIWS